MIEFIVTFMFIVAGLNAAADIGGKAYAYAEPKVQELKTEACQKYNCNVLSLD